MSVLNMADLNSGHDWATAIAARQKSLTLGLRRHRGFGMGHCPTGRKLNCFGSNAGRNRYRYRCGRCRLDDKVQLGNLTCVDPAMCVMFVDSTAVRDA